MAKKPAVRIITRPDGTVVKVVRFIKAQVISSRLRAVLDPRGLKVIKPDDPIELHIKGGPGAVRAFANVLNNSPQFSRDKLSLVPGDLAGADTINDIGAAIIACYQRNGWSVVL